MCGLAIVSKLKRVSQYKLRKENIELLYLQQKFSFQVFFCECQKKKNPYPSLLAGFSSRIVCASQLICLSCMNIGIFDVQLFSDNKEPIDIIMRPLFFYVSQVMDEPLSWR